MNLNDILLRANLPAIRERFAARLAVDAVTGCHVWQGRRNNKGHQYGRITIGRTQFQSHRVAWVLHKGFLPEGCLVLHRCDNPPCCNPDHLFIGDRAVNMADMAAKNRSVSGQRNWTNKLTHEQVQEIRLAGGAQADIAERYGVGQNNVGRIKRGETWRHLPWPNK